jgi:hypothetical protein
VLQQVTELFAVRQLPGAWHREDRRIMDCGDQVQRGIGSKAGLGDHHDLPHPRGRHTVLQPLPKEEVLMPFDLRVNRGEGDGNAPTAPTREAQDHLKPKRIRIMRAVARRMPPWVLPATLVFQRAISHELQDASGRRRERPECGGRHVIHPGLCIPWARPDQAPRRSRLQRGWQVRLEPLECPCAGVADQGDQPPTEAQNMPRLGAAKVPLERVAYVVYGAWEARATPPVSPACVLWDVGCSQKTQER